MNSDNGWKLANADLFWGDVAFYDHVVQLYDSEEVFIETLAGFVSTGIHIGDCCVIALTKDHFAILDERLQKMGVNTDEAVADHRYIPVDAEETLTKFLVKEHVDDELFNQTIAPIFQICRNSKRVIRAGGEMVAMLAAQGNWTGALRLEELWNKLHENGRFSIYCAYPKNIFANGAAVKTKHVCAQHSRMISGSEKQSAEIYYRDPV